MPRTATRPRKANLIRATLREDFAFSNTPCRVDREKGIIYDVKVSGRSSPNTHGVAGVEGTEYAPEAYHQALSLYENAPVNKNHPDRTKPGADRKSEDRIGWLVGPYVKDGEVYAKELHLFLSDDLTPKLFEAAEKHPESFAMSHNADGRGEIRDGKYVVTQIPRVRSVDVVADGGTNRSLFESERPMKTLVEIIQSSPVAAPLKAELLEAANKLCEDDATLADPMAEPTGETGDWKKTLAAAVAELLQADDEEAHAAAKKIMSILKPGGATPAPESDAGDKPKDDDKPDDKKKDEKKMESRLEALEKRNAELKAGAALTKLCESEQFQPTPTQREALAGLDTDAKRKALIKELRQGAAKPRTGPRSSGPIFESNDPAVIPTESKDFAKALLR